MNPGMRADMVSGATFPDHALSDWPVWYAECLVRQRASEELPS
jgi:hypothetical protein